MHTLSPAIDRYVATEQMLQQQDPVSSGASKGLDAAKMSMSLTPQIRRPSPWGRMMAATGAAMKPPTPGTGTAGMLQSIAQAMGPGMQAYHQAQDTNTAIDMKLMEMMRKQQEDEVERKYRNDVLAETKRYHDLAIGEKNREQKLAEEAHRKANEEIKSGEIVKRPITTYTKAERDRLMKDALETRKTENGVNSTLREAADLAKLITDNPHLYGSMRAIMLAPDNDDAAMTAIMKNAVLSQKDRHDLARFIKKKEKLIQNQILSAGGNKATDMYKKVLEKSSPDPRHLPETIQAIIDDINLEYGPLKEKIEDAKELIGKGNVVVRPANNKPRAEEPATVNAQSQTSEGAAKRKALEQRAQQLLQERQQLTSGMQGQ